MKSTMVYVFLALAAAALPITITGQRITTIQLDGVQYFVSRMNPYSPELNYFLAYQYCRSLGLQLASFETKEKADSITTYLTNAGYNKYDFWTSGNNLGTDMYIWMSTGLPFNATFNLMKKGSEAGPSQAVQSPQIDESMDPLDVPQGSTAPQRTARHGTEHVLSNGCVALKAPTYHWEPQHCGAIKDFICEQTRCYYYNYGSIPVSSAQGKPLSLTTTTTAQPLTSSTPIPPLRSEHLPTHFTLNDLLGKIRPSSLDGLQSPHLKTVSSLAHKNLPQVDGHYSGINRAQEPQSDKGATVAPSTYEGDTNVNDTPTQLPNDPDNSVDDDEAATVGPYNHSADIQMGDDPNAYAQPNSNPEEDYVSTIEPESATTYKSETMRKIAGKVLAAPSY